MNWIEQLEQAKKTLVLLIGQCGSSPAESKMRTKLFAAIDILDTQITVERELMP